MASARRVTPPRSDFVAQEPEAFLIWGGGGHGKVIADLVRACGFEVLRFVDADASKERLRSQGLAGVEGR
jgi:hypothetical protein